VPIWVNVAFNDAAANTVNVPGAAGAADAAALDDAELAGLEPDATEEFDTADLAAADDDAAALVVDDAVLLLELQPTTRVVTHSAARVATA
jgi:hypothetical protein